MLTRRQRIVINSQRLAVLPSHEGRAESKKNYRDYKGAAETIDDLQAVNPGISRTQNVMCQRIADGKNI